MQVFYVGHNIKFHLKSEIKRKVGMYSCIVYNNKNKILNNKSIQKTEMVYTMTYKMIHNYKTRTINKK